MSKPFWSPIFITLSLPALLSMPVSAQTVPTSVQPSLIAPPHPSWLTDAVVFRFLLKHVVITEAHADELLAKGKDDSPERRLFKNAAKLTDQEETLLKSTAADADNALKTFDKAAAIVVSNLKARYPTISALPASAVQQLQSLDSQRQQIVLDHMTALRTGMAAGRFQLFYNFAWGTEGPRIRPARPGTKPPAGSPRPAQP